MAVRATPVTAGVHQPPGLPAGDLRPAERPTSALQLADRRLHRERHWPAVLALIGTLATRPLQRAQLMLHNVGLQLAGDGLPAHLLTRPQDYPLLDQAGWLLDDWGVAASARRAAFEQQLFVAASLDFLAAWLRLGRLDPHTFMDGADQPLEAELQRQADRHWAGLFPADSPFWTHHREAHDAALADPAADDAPTSPGPWALVALPAIATALWADRAEALPDLLALCHRWRAVLQAVDQLASLRRDLTNGRVTPPVRRALDTMGMAGASAVRVETGLAALSLTGTLDKTLREHEESLASAHALAGRAALPTWQAHGDRIHLLLRQVRALFGLKHTPGEALPPPLNNFFVPAPDVPANVLLKAEAYLLSDPGFREAWDIQRHASASTLLAVGRSFASSVILDILCAHGHPMPAAVDFVLETLRANAYRYWDQRLVMPDADDLALALRLVPHASHPARWRAALQTPLRWMRENQRPSGQIPVWFLVHDRGEPMSEAMVLYGADCASVEANLLVSLIDSDWAAHREVVEASARVWCRRWLGLGLGACEHYTPLYSLWVATEVVGRLLAHTVNGSLLSLATAVDARLKERLAVEAGRTDLGPQDAAFLMLASLRRGALPFDAGWVTLLHKQQRPDGCWEGEPLYVVPSARNLSTQWFRSRAVTTAFAYHALKHHQAWRQGKG